LTGSHAVLLAAEIIAAVTPLGVAAVLFLRRRRPTGSVARTLLALIALGWVFGVWACLIEPETLAVREVAVQSETWSGPPLRIGVISDTHVSSPHVDAARMRAIVGRMNALKPDIVVLLGDYVGSHEPADARSAAERAEILAGVEAFRGLKAPLGVYGILGNHDWWYDGWAVERAMRKAGVTMLVNGSVPVERAGRLFHVAGVESLSSTRQRPWMLMALRDVPPQEPVIVLMHEPDSFAQVPNGVALSLAGHSHCGQVRLPFVGALVLPSPGSRRWPCGLYDDGRKLYVTGGVGTSVLPVRFLARPEIALITLSPPAALAQRRPPH
jgi:predicted MPP superfamily phosphohydrolase